MILVEDIRFLNSLLKRGNILTYLWEVLINENSIVLKKYKSTIEIDHSSKIAFNYQKNVRKWTFSPPL